MFGHWISRSTRPHAVWRSNIANAVPVFIFLLLLLRFFFARLCTLLRFIARRVFASFLLLRFRCSERCFGYFIVRIHLEMPPGKDKEEIKKTFRRYVWSTHYGWAISNGFAVLTKKTPEINNGQEIISNRGRGTAKAYFWHTAHTRRTVILRGSSV